jgi:hypothetical protein
MMLRLKTDEMIGGCRKVRNEELHNWYATPNIITKMKSRRIKWEAIVSRMKEKNAYTILVGKLEGKRSIGRPRRRLENLIKTDLREIGWGSMDCVRLAEDNRPMAGSCKIGNEHLGSLKYWEILELQSDWGLHKKDSAPWS